MIPKKDKKSNIPDRYAGVLLHISSLPGKYGTGDFGKEAFDFIDALEKAGQSYWQILPLNPVLKEASYSPYSTYSAFAGNILFINPDRLVDQGYLSRKYLKGRKKPKGKADFVHAEDVKTPMLNEAYLAFLKGKSPEGTSERFKKFKDGEKYWINDFALFCFIKNQLPGTPWWEWPEDLKFRKRRVLKEYIARHKVEIDKFKFFQFLFYEQWTEIKSYAHAKGIKLFGDLPIYVGRDSADVWSNPQYFNLNEETLEMTSVAGVPPDYFNENGQLWNMPVFDWKALKKDYYDWWIKRIIKNLELFDLVRLDHFRGFSAYYDIPAGEETAKNGQWIEGPGFDLFEAIRDEVPEMPFVAEDLGSIDQPVYDLRDEFNLPGMHVTQFAFGDNMPQGDHTPHNYKQNSVVYTGTHDNNTTKGWYKQELDQHSKKRWLEYDGTKAKYSKITDQLIRFAYRSVSRIAIVPMQDVLSLDYRARMNMPSTTEGNWTWQLKPGQFGKKHTAWLKELCEFYGRSDSVFESQRKGDT